MTLAVTREVKQKFIEELLAEIQKSQALIITDYRGIPTADLNGLRNQLRGAQTPYHIAKNTLVILALKRAGLPVPENLLEGPTALAFLQGDLAGPARILSDFFKDKTAPIKGAIVGHSVYDAKGVEELTRLPGKEQLYALFLGSLQGPASGLVGVLNGALSELVRTLQARAEQGAPAAG